MFSDDSFQVIAKYIFQPTCLIGFDEVHATLIFTTYFRSIFTIKTIKTIKTIQALKRFLHIQGISYPL